MRWDDLAPQPGTDIVTTPVVRGGDDITTLVWRIEGSVDDYALSWRAWATANGILDPFQVAGVTDRVLAGKPLAPGTRLTPPNANG